MAKSRETVGDNIPYRLIGFLLIAGVPALVWPLAVLLVCNLIGYEISTSTLIYIGVAVFGFLAFVAAGLTLSGSDPVLEAEPEDQSRQTAPPKASKPRHRRAA